MTPLYLEDFDAARLEGLAGFASPPGSAAQSELRSRLAAERVGKALVGQPDLAIQHFETALRLSPPENRANSFVGIGMGHFFAARFEEARKMLLLISARETELGADPPISCIPLRADGLRSAFGCSRAG